MKFPCTLGCGRDLCRVVLNFLLQKIPQGFKFFWPIFYPGLLMTAGDFFLCTFPGGWQAFCCCFLFPDLSVILVLLLFHPWAALTGFQLCVRAWFQHPSLQDKEDLTCVPFLGPALFCISVLSAPGCAFALSFPLNLFPITSHAPREEKIIC